MSLNNSNFSSFFLRVNVLILELKEILHDLDNKFLSTFFQNFQKHPPQLMYQIEDTNHDIHLNFLKSLQTLFTCMQSVSGISSIFTFL